MKKLIIIIIVLCATVAQAKTLQDFIDEGLTKKDLEKGFIEVSRSFLTISVPKGFPRSEYGCDENGKNCTQYTWQAYCAGGYLEDIKADMIIITLDRCGYPDGQNRRYPPSEIDINLFLDYFGENVLPKESGLLTRENYLEEF